jgi:hypothetical protein
VVTIAAVLVRQISKSTLNVHHQCEKMDPTQVAAPVAASEPAAPVVPQVIPVPQAVDVPAPPEVSVPTACTGLQAPAPETSSPAVKKVAAKKTSAKAEGELIIPKGSVKRVIKIDKDVRLVAADAVLVITKATVNTLNTPPTDTHKCEVGYFQNVQELFLEKLGMAAYDRAKDDNRKMVKYEDVAAARAADDNLEFLDGT